METIKSIEKQIYEEVKSKNPDLVGRLFSAKIIELALANYPGFFTGGGVRSGGPVLVYWPALIDSKHIKDGIKYFGGQIDHILSTNTTTINHLYCYLL